MNAYGRRPSAYERSMRLFLSESEHQLFLEKDKEDNEPSTRTVGLTLLVCCVLLLVVTFSGGGLLLAVGCCVALIFAVWFVHGLRIKARIKKEEQRRNNEK